MHEGVDPLLFKPVPVNRERQANVYAAHVEICYQAMCIASHERCFSRCRSNLEHYLDELSKRPDARRSTLWEVACGRSLARRLQDHTGKRAQPNPITPTPGPFSVVGNAHPGQSYAK
jgi:hypothetical protein